MSFLLLLQSFRLEDPVEKEGGYIVQKCVHADEKLLRDALDATRERIEAFKVTVPKDGLVPKHMHNCGIEYFIPIGRLKLCIEGQPLETEDIVKVEPGIWHSLEGGQEFFIVKEYDHVFDKVLPGA